MVALLRHMIWGSCSVVLQGSNDERRASNNRSATNRKRSATTSYFGGPLEWRISEAPAFKAQYGLFLLALSLLPGRLGSTSNPSRRGPRSLGYLARSASKPPVVSFVPRQIAEAVSETTHPMGQRSTEAWGLPPMQAGSSLTPAMGRGMLGSDGREDCCKRFQDYTYTSTVRGLSRCATWFWHTAVRPTS